MGHALAANTNVATAMRSLAPMTPARRWGLGLAVDGRLDDAGAERAAAAAAVFLMKERRVSLLADRRVASS